MNWDKGSNTKAGGPIRAQIKTFVCPTTPGNASQRVNNNRGVLDFVAVEELVRPNPSVTGPIVAGDGTFVGVMGHTKKNGPKVMRRMAEIIDGTTNTLLLAECAGRNWHFLMNKRQATDITAGPWANPNSRIKVGGFDPSNPTNATGPCAVNCDNKKEIYSFHPAGANVLMADGSVHFLQKSVSITIVYSLTSRNGGELLPGLSF
jgi:prepilin-type processing-associated H-X9-DG protein